MKNVFILLIIFFIYSCKSTDEYRNEYAISTIDSTFSALDVLRKRASYYDSTINSFELNDSVLIDTSYVSLCENYEKLKKEILSLDHDSIVKVYHSIRIKDTKLACNYAYEFQNYARHLQEDVILAYYLFYKEKQKRQKHNKKILENENK